MFNRNNSLKLLAGYNALTAAVVYYQYQNDPNANPPEYMLDIFTHLFQVIQLSGILDKYKDSMSDFAQALNYARTFDIGARMYTGGSTIPFFANVIDVGNHAINVAGIFAKDRLDKEENQQSQSMQR